MVSPDDLALLTLTDDPHIALETVLDAFRAGDGAPSPHAPEKADAYRIDFDLLLRARDRDVTFGKFAVGGLAARMRWEKGRPRHTHLNAKGDTGRACDQKRAAWCTVERPFGDETFGIAFRRHIGKAAGIDGRDEDQRRTADELAHRIVQPRQHLLSNEVHGRAEDFF